MSIQGNWARRKPSRREFLGLGGAAAVALAVSPSVALAKGAAGATHPGGSGFDPVVPDPAGLVDLPAGFTYKVISLEGTPMSNGAPVPGDHDGMAAFRGRGGSTVLVRNHELMAGDPNPVPATNPYEASAPGGTTGVVLDRDLEVVEEYVTSSGTLNNCAGGATPWGAWSAHFTRLEGSNFVGGPFWFDDTQGGEARRDQVYRLIPSGGHGYGRRDPSRGASRSSSARG